MDLSPKFFCFNFLPPELQIRIFEFLPPRDVLSSVGRVCKDWANLLTEDSLWHTLHVQHFGRIKQGKTWKAQCKEVYSFNTIKYRHRLIFPKGNAKDSQAGDQNPKKAFLLGGTVWLC